SSTDRRCNTMNPQEGRKIIQTHDTSSVHWIVVLVKVPPRIDVRGDVSQRVVHHDFEHLDSRNSGQPLTQPTHLISSEARALMNHNPLRQCRPGLVEEFTNLLSDSTGVIA